MWDEVRPDTHENIVEGHHHKVCKTEAVNIKGSLGKEEPDCDKVKDCCKDLTDHINMWCSHTDQPEHVELILSKNKVGWYN